MEIVIYQNQNWHQIPVQDNPAFNLDGSGRKNERMKKCLLVMKVLPYESKAVGNDGFVVIEVPIRGDVIRRGLFWNIDDATKFAVKISENDKN